MPLPLVSIVTPVYNNAEYLAECIESVLAQSYSHWDYTIVNNCSTDGTLSVAQKYAMRDVRIRIVNNERYLSIIENHNHAIRQISSESRYCKFVFADDWLYPTCIEEMVRVAEEHPSVGLVGAYTMDGQAVLWQGPAYPAPQISGRETCRNMLLGGPYVLGPMTSLLVRSDLIRKRPTFFDERTLHGDTMACFDLLVESDYGYVHQVLSFNRARRESTGAFAGDFDSIILGVLVVFLEYGRVLLSDGEYKQYWKQLNRKYHRVLANNVVRLRPKAFWKYHADTLAAFGGRIEWRLLATSVMSEVGSRLLHPVWNLGRGLQWWSSAWNRLTATGKQAHPQRLP
ncbi:MAG TPA: glycosyltransferase family 2 protein [Terracidiphilus sp.]|nr:glycosyltransferase family 2 protein [Terracidiphilus sp.]